MQRLTKTIMQGKNILIYLMMLAPVSFALTSCGGEEKNKASEATEVDNEVEEEEITDDSEESTVFLPSPIQVAEIFNKAGLTFDYSAC